MRDRRFLALAAGTFAVLVFLRLGHQSLWLDEMMSLTVAREAPPAMKAFFLQFPEQHPLYYLVLRIWLKLGTSEAVLRSFSAVAALLALWPFYELARDLFDRTVARVATLLMATSPFWLYYGQEARMYSLLGLLAVVSSLVFLRWSRRPSRRLAVLYVAVGVAGAYTHFFFLFVPIFHLAYLAVLRRREETPSLALALVLVGAIYAVYAPWGVLILTHMPESQSWKGARTVLFAVPYALLRFSVGYSEFLTNAGWKEHVGRVLRNSVVVLAVGVPVFGVLALAGLRKAVRSGARGIFLLAGLTIPVVLALLASFRIILVGERYFIVAFPFYILLLAIGLRELWRREPRAWRAAAVVVTIGLASVVGKALYDYYFDPAFGKVQWREAAAYVGRNAAPGDAVVFHAGYVDRVFHYYYRRGGWPELNPLDATAGNETPPETLWLVRSYVPIDSTGCRRALARRYDVESRRFFPKEVGILVQRYRRTGPATTRSNTRLGPAISGTVPDSEWARRVARACS